MKITRLFTEYQECPIGIDEAIPRFSWEMEAEEQNVFQSAYRIRIEEEESGRCIWDSGKAASGLSTGIAYEGPALQPCTGYHVHVRVWDQLGGEAQADGRFETGLMDPDIRAWEGAQWIAAPRYTVAARTRGVFCVTSDFCMAEGAKRAGIVFGEGDYRLLDGMLNEYGRAGENYIRYEVNIEDMAAPGLDIYRVGYAPEDEKEKPFTSVLLKDEKTGRILNPRGRNDVFTYPRLNRIGFFAGKEGKVCFKNYTVSNLRAPQGIFIEEKPGKSLYGRESIFQEILPTEQDCLW